MPIVDLPDVVEFASKDIFEKHVHSFVIMKDVPAVPLLFSAESRAEGVPEGDGPDCQYSIFTTLFYEDGSTFWHTYLDFPPGTHGWERVECFYRPRVAINKMRVDYFCEHKKGKVAYRNFRIEEVAPRPKPDRRVVLLGDSNVITSYLAPADRVDAFLASRLRDAFPALKIDVENAGVGGDAIKPFFETKRYERDLLTLDRIDIIFVRFGINDRVKYGADVFKEKHRELIRRLRADFPGIRIVMETGTFVDYPKHCDRDYNAELKGNYDALRSLADEADGILDVWDLMRLETERGNWDLRYRNNPIGKLLIDDRADAGHEDDPSWFSNIHHNVRCNRLIARWERDLIVKKGWMG